jgi:hypothetical protein
MYGNYAVAIYKCQKYIPKKTEILFLYIDPKTTSRLQQLFAGNTLIVMLFNGISRIISKRR